jgi:hypothetical protein
MSSVSSIASAQQLNYVTERKTNPLHAIEAKITASLPANVDDKTTISTAARELSAAQSTSSTPSGNDETAAFDTSEGSKNLNIDNYFSPPSGTDGKPFTFPPLLLPSQRNIDALSKHISTALPSILAQNNIPSPPASITYDESGKIQLPSNYLYASKFKQALADNPAIARELSAINAFSSLSASIQNNVPSQSDVGAAATPAAAKQGYQSSGHQQDFTPVLNFSENGNLSITFER